MYRHASILAAGLLSLAVAAPAAATDVMNVGGTVTVAQVEWAQFDSDTFTGGYLVAAKDQKGGTVAEYFLVVEQLVQCTGAETPDDPADDRFDFRYRYEYGVGPADVLTIASRYAGATAQASLDLTIDRYDACLDELTTEVVEDVAVRLDMVATSPLVRESGHGSFHIPSLYNAHGSSQQTYRRGTGTATIGDQVFEGEAVVGTVSWREHLVSR